MGEETDSVAESASKLQEKIKALTGVDIVDMNGAYKDTYTILKEIGEVWKDLDPMDQAAALELMAGKNRANTLAAILNNMEDLEGAYESALNAEGSALKENEAYLSSIQGRIDLFNNSLQTMWMNFLNTDVVKFIVDAGTALIKIVDNIGLIETALMGVVAYLTIIKKQDFSKSMFGGLVGGKNNKIQLLEGQALEDELVIFNTELAKGAEAFGVYKLKAKEAGNGMDILVDKVEQGVIQTKNGKVAAEDYTVALQSQSNAATKAAHSEKMKSVAIGLSVMAISGIISAIQSYTSNIKTLDERYEELQSNISTVESDINSFNSEIESIEEQIDALSNKNLTIAEAEELRRLKEQSIELQRQKELREDMLETYNKQDQITTLEMFNKKISETAAGQEKVAEQTKTWAKVLGTVADIALVIGGIAVTGATFGGATALGTAMMGAGMSGAGTSLAGVAADKWGGNSKSVGEDLTAWYDSYIEAIAKKDQEVAEAEAKYFSSLTDSDYDKWQKKLDASNALKEDLYNNLEELQGYIDGLEYNDATASTIDSFNKLVANINAKSLDGDINAQISSIESLKSEFAELSKGVDENGNNIALSAEEYARYNAIVAQVLGYQTGLTQSYDENGNAILRTADAQYTYNELLEQSIALLKQQRLEAAQGLINDENFIKSYDSFIDNSKKSVKDIDWTAYSPRALSVDFFQKNPHGFGGGANWGTDDVVETISRVIGVDFNLAFGDSQEFLRDNVRSIQQNREQITAQLTKDLESMDMSDDVISSYVQQTNEWLDHLSGQIIEVNEKTKAQFKQTLYTIPQANENYYDFDGTSVAFINDYIDAYVDGIENIEDLSDKEVLAIRDNISSFVDAVGDNKIAQDLISELFTLDVSSMSAKTYEKSVNDMLDSIGKEISISDDIKNDLFSQLVPDDTNVDLMLESVSKKLEDGSHKLQSLTLSELRVAYRYSIDAADGSLTFEELEEAMNEGLSGQLSGPIVQTYSTLIEQATNYKDILNQTSEIVADNTEVTQEYKDAVVALGVSEEELADCFYDDNKLIVKNSNKLNDLVKSAKKNTVQNVKLAKSQARLQYYELYKKMAGYIDAEGNVTKGTNAQIIALSKEMNLLERAISKYSMLETELLGAANAYEQFELAQEADSSTDYMGSVEGMVLALGQAFNTAELGSETAQAAIAGLVPESVYEDLDTVDEKMAAIYDYFKNGKLSQYLTLEYDDDGNISSAEMKLGNLRKFIEDGLSNNTFDGSDWQHFEFSESFLDGLDEADDKLQYFADNMGVTKEVAFAFVKSINDHDIEWLNGDYSSMFDNLTPETLENNIYNTTQAMTDLSVQLASGKITAEEYQKSMFELYKQEEALAERARTEAQSWYEKTEKLSEYNSQLEEYYKQLESGKDNDGNVIDAEAVKAKVEETTANINTLTRELAELEEPTELTLQVALDDVQKDIDTLEKDLKAEKINLEKAIAVDAEGKYYVTTEFAGNEKLEAYVGLLNEQHTLEVQMGAGTPDVLSTLQSVNDTLTNIQKLLETKFNLQVDTEGAVTATRTFKDMWDGIKDKSVTLWSTVKQNVIEFFTRTPKEAEVGGTARATGTAHKSGDWGLPKAEKDSLVGELGQEIVVDPHSGKYYTVGDNGAEMVDLPKDAIIFNHKQTEELLKNGHINSRGKAYAEGTEGNAHVTIWPTGSSQSQWEGTGYSGPDDSTYDKLSDAADSLSDAASDISDSSDEFREVFDWIEVRLEEINEDLDLKNAQLENAPNYAKKNSIIDSMININEQLYDTLIAGAQKYYSYARTLLSKIPAEYRKAAQDGTIAIETFVGEADEKVLEAIQEYRDWVQKGADVTRQAEEVLTEIRSLAIQRIENARHSGDVRADIEDAQTEKLQNAVDLDEAKGLITSPAYYTAMMENSGKKIEYLTKSLGETQAAFDEAVRNGSLIKGSDDWYEQLQNLYDIDAAIDEATIELEEFQNEINDLHWDNFDELINRIDYLQDETYDLIGIMENCGDAVDDNGRWTNEGITILGLYAQQMEIAEYRAKQYAIAIDQLNAAYAAGEYSEIEYLTKLNELKSAQYDSINAYYDAQKAIVDQNKARVDAIKNGIQKEIDAYEELINKKKEELAAEKDLYDFKKSVAEKSKDIADLERKLAALSGDNSASATAQRKKLEAELAEANAALEETYYDRSIEQQQNALDKELEDFKKQKDAEIEVWEEYLENVERVVADSLSTVQANASTVYDTLTDKAEEYDLTVSDAIVSPWKDGALAMDEYDGVFGNSMSSTMQQLELLKQKWQEVIDKMAEAGQLNVDNINQENADYIAAEKDPTPSGSSSGSGTGTGTNNNTNTSKAITVGGKINAGNATLYSDSSGGGASKQYYSSDPIYVVLGESGNYIKVRHHSLSSGVTGWFKKSDVKALAKGTKKLEESGIVNIDELGEELVLRAVNGRLTYMEKGSGVIPADLTENLMKWGELNPQDVLDRNRPSIGMHPEIHNTEINLSIQYGDMVSIGEYNGGDIADLEKMVAKQFEKHTRDLNNAIRKYSR